MRVEWTIMADAAEVVNNKLYLMGGGWDHLMIGRKFPARQEVAVALSVLLDGSDVSGERLTLTIDDQTNKRLATVNANLNVKNPAPPGQSRRVQLAFKLPLRFEQPGTCRVIATAGDQPIGGTSFRVSQRKGQGVQTTPSEDLQA